MYLFKLLLLFVGGYIPRSGVVVQSLVHFPLFVTPCQASLSLTISRSLLKFMSVESVMPSKHLMLCHPLLLLPSIFPSIGVFSSELALHIKWLKHHNFSFSPSDEYSRFISFRINRFDLLAVQRTLKGLLGTTVQKHQFFDTQPSL